MEELRAERDGLQRAMRTRALIEQAKGILMAREGIAAEEAFLRLRQRSQHSNVRLADLAAALIADATPPPAATQSPPAAAHRAPSAAARRAQAAAAHRGPPPGASRAPAAPPAVGDGRVPAERAGPPVESALHAQHLLIAGHLDEATGYDDVVAALVGAVTGWPAPAAVTLAVTEPDGALRVVASHGLSAELVSQWHRVPPQVDAPLTSAATTGTAVWLTDPEQVRTAFPMSAAMNLAVGAWVTLPLTVDDRRLGAVGLAWRDPVTLDALRRSYLVAAAGAVAHAVDRLGRDAVPDSDPEAELWIRAVLDGALTPAGLLSPVHVGDEVVDFRLRYVNAMAEQLALERRTRLTGSTLLTVAPRLGGRLLVPLFRTVLADGVPRQLDDVAEQGVAGRYSVRATRLGRTIVATLRRHSTAELLYDDLVAAGRRERTAVYRWDLTTGALLTTPVLRELLAWSARPDPGPRAALWAVDPAGRPALRRAAFRALRHGRPMEVVVPVGQGRRWLRVTGEPVGRAGRAVALRGAVHDVTALRAQHSREQRLAEARAVQRGKRPAAEPEP